MRQGPRRFLLQAIDPEFGNPALEALFVVSNLDDLRAILGNVAKDDPELTWFCHLDADDLAKIVEMFGVPFDPGERAVCLYEWRWFCEAPYLVHTGYELSLLLDGRKQLAQMGDSYPPERHEAEDLFDRFVAQGLLHKAVFLEPFDEPRCGQGDQVFHGHRTVYYTRKGEEWRIAAFELMWTEMRKQGWSEAFERLEGMLYGYEGWQIDWWIEHSREHRPWRDQSAGTR